MKVKYPKYPKKYRKVTPSILKQIKSMYARGHSRAEIARRFNLAHTTVTRRLDPIVHERALRETRKWLKIYMQDEDYRKRINKKSLESIKKRYKSDKKYQEFLKKFSKANKDERRELVREYNKRYYQEHYARNKTRLFKRKHGINKNKTPAPQKNKQKVVKN